MSWSATRRWLRNVRSDLRLHPARSIPTPSTTPWDVGSIANRAPRPGSARCSSAMRRAAAVPGEHDFAGFAAAGGTGRPRSVRSTGWMSSKCGGPRAHRHRGERISGTWCIVAVRWSISGGDQVGGRHAGDPGVAGSVEAGPTLPTTGFAPSGCGMNEPTGRTKAKAILCVAAWTLPLHAWRRIRFPGCFMRGAHRTLRRWALTFVLGQEYSRIRGAHRVPTGKVSGCGTRVWMTGGSGFGAVEFLLRRPKPAQARSFSLSAARSGFLCRSPGRSVPGRCILFRRRRLMRGCGYSLNIRRNVCPSAAQSINNPSHASLHISTRLIWEASQDTVLSCEAGWGMMSSGVRSRSSGRKALFERADRFSSLGFAHSEKRASACTKFSMVARSAR